MNALYELLADCTIQLRKGAEVEHRTDGCLDVTEVFAMPHQDMYDGLEKVDCEFLTIGVDRQKAEQRREEFIRLLDQLPAELMASGPSYIAVGAEIGDQGAAFQLFALGKALQLWDLVTPKMLGMTGDAARKAAAQGFVMITGYRKKEPK